MVLEFLIFSVKLIVTIILIFCWYQSLDRLTYLYEINFNNSIVDFNNISYFLTKYPLLLLLSLLVILLTLTQNISKKIDYNNIFLSRYFFFILRRFTNFFVSYLIIKLKKITAFTIIYNFESFIFFKESKNFFISFFLLWRPLFKRISYFGKLMKGKIFWKN